MSAELLAELARAKVTFQLRAITALLTARTPVDTGRVKDETINGRPPPPYPPSTGFVAGAIAEAKTAVDDPEAL